MISRITWLPALVCLPLLVACGSDGNDPVVRDPFIKYTVNGKQSPSSVSVTRVYTEGLDSNDKPRYYPCDPDLYANAATVESLAPDYCVNEITTATVTFTIQFFNNSLETLGLSFQGLGYRIQIFEYDESNPGFIGDEVWNSDYAEQQAREIRRANGEDVEDFDPFEEHFVDLGPAQAYKPQSSREVLGTAFFGLGNIRDGYQNGVSFSPEGLFVRPTDGADEPLCDWSAVETESGTPPFERVLCQGRELLPLPSAADTTAKRYWIRTRFNFNNWEDQPEDILLTVMPRE